MCNALLPHTLQSARMYQSWNDIGVSGLVENLQSPKEPLTFCNTCRHGLHPVPPQAGPQLGKCLSCPVRWRWGDCLGAGADVWIETNYREGSEAWLKVPFMGVPKEYKVLKMNVRFFSEFLSKEIEGSGGVIFASWESSWPFPGLLLVGDIPLFLY